MKLMMTLQSRVLKPGVLLGVIISATMVLTASADPVNCAPPPAGLVSWWRAEGNGLDQVGGNNGVLLNGAGFAAGEAGQAFSFNGINSYVEVPDSPSLRLTNELTIEFWLKRQTLNPPTPEYFLEKGGDYTGGVQNYGVAVGSPTINNFLHFTCAGAWWGAGPIGDLNWHHYAVTARNGQSAPQIYVDGVLQVLTHHGGGSQINLYPSTRPLHIGAQVDPVINWYYYSKTLIDELGLYNRALTGVEIQAIYTAGSAGKCSSPNPPSILSQPSGQTLYVGNTAAFTVIAGGSSPLTYHWRLAGVELPGATGSSLTLNNVQLTNAGNYSVVVSNQVGWTVSSNALLSVLQPGDCSLAPSGLVSWWRGEGNALDQVGGNNGVLLNGAGFSAGEVGQAFIFNGTNSYVEVPDSPSLRLTSQLTIEFWVKRQDLQKEDYIINKGGAYTLGKVNYGVTITQPQWGGKLAFTFAGGARHSLSITDLNWHHCAVTARNGDVDPSFYVDGVQRPVTLRQGASTMNLYPSAEPLHIGAHLDPISGWYYYSKAIVDELSIYNRVLSATEIQAIYMADGTGKCHQVPTIIVQPASLAVTETSSATFTVTAAGTSPLSYQWRWNGTNISGATGTSLTLSNVEPAQAGNYAVCVTNAFGSVISSNALLTVNRIPVAQCADVVVSAGGNCQADASVNHGSFDPDGDPIIVSQTPPGPYPLGTNRVTLTVTDDKGASNSCSALVIVPDRTPPALSCPAGQVLEFQDERGAVAAYNVTATDACSAVTLLGTPPSGSVFPIGATPVHVQATDGSGNSAQCSFTVTVLGAQGVKSNVLAELIALRTSANPGEPFAQKFDAAIEHLADSLKPAYWIDETHLQPKGGNTAMNEEKLAVSKLQEIMDSNKCPVDPAALQGFIDRIVKCDRLLAVISIQDAARAGLNAKKVAEDLAMVAKGDREADAGHYANAIEHYRNAWRHALQLRLQVGLNPDGTTRLQFVGNNSKSYGIEVSTDMVNWLPLGACTADAEGNVEFTAPTATNQTLRFYRAVEQ